MFLYDKIISNTSVCVFIIHAKLFNFKWVISDFLISQGINMILFHKKGTCPANMADVC